MKLILITSLLVSFVGCATNSKKMPQTIKEAVSNPMRSSENILRDQYRHPVETLEFFGIQPDMTVIEVSPSRGWYTQILAPYLYEKGQYIMAEPETDPRGYTVPRNEWYEKYPHLKERSKKVVFQPGTKIDLGEPNSVDMVLTFRNIHNWFPAKNVEEAFKHFHKVLKPGGVLGVVEHRANPKNKFDPKSGYLPEKEVIRLAQKAGFKLAAKSEVNANPKDTAKHPHGVWTLPPSLRGGDKYLEIGESDRMTLKFVK